MLYQTKYRSVENLVFSYVKSRHSTPHYSRHTSIVIAITGGVAVGKTLFAYKLKQIIQEEGWTSEVISLDTYQKPRAKRTDQNPTNGYYLDNWNFLKAQKDLHNLINKGNTIKIVTTQRKKNKGLPKR